MSDGYSVGTVGWSREECGCVGREVGVSFARRSGIVVPPVFSDFRGKQWESEFPVLLARYYDALGGFGASGLHDCSSSGGGFLCDRNVVCADSRGSGEGGSGVENVVERDESAGGIESESGEGDGSFVRGPSGGDECDVSGSVAGCDVRDAVVRGKHYEKNRARRLRDRCLRKNSGLQESLEAKWKAENELAVEQAKRKLELLRSRDLDSEKKMQRAQIMRTTESAKVQTERAYATLKRTGNVPGFAETVVTDGSCPALSPSRSDGTCISPDSSVSQQEIRAMMKELEDYKLTMSRIERDNPALVAHHMEGHGVKTAFTLDSDGLCPVDEPGCMGADGKYHLDSYEPNPRFYKDRFRAEEFAEKYFGS